MLGCIVCGEKQTASAEKVEGTIVIPAPASGKSDPEVFASHPVSLRHRPKGPRVGRGAPRPFTVHPDGKRAGITPTARAGSPP